MVVVKQEHDLVREARQFVEQCGQDNLPGVGAHPEEFEGTSRNPWVRFLQCGDHVRPEPDRVVVGRVQGNPGKPVAFLVAGDPLSQQRRFPPPGRRVKQRELVVVSR